MRVRIVLVGKKALKGARPQLTSCIVNEVGSTRGGKSKHRRHRSRGCDEQEEEEKKVWRHLSELPESLLPMRSVYSFVSKIYEEDARGKLNRKVTEARTRIARELEKWK